MRFREFAETSAGFVNRILAPARIQITLIRSSEAAEYRELVTRHRAISFRDFQIARGIIAPGHITLDEARFLGELVRKTDSSEPIVEIGTLFGFSTIVLLLYKHPDQVLFTVDNYSCNPFGIS